LPVAASSTMESEKISPKGSVLEPVEAVGVDDRSAPGTADHVVEAHVGVERPAPAGAVGRADLSGGLHLALPVPDVRAGHGMGGVVGPRVVETGVVVDEHQLALGERDRGHELVPGREFHVGVSGEGEGQAIGGHRPVIGSARRVELLARAVVLVRLVLGDRGRGEPLGGHHHPRVAGG
jgi:hypothetical protein